MTATCAGVFSEADLRDRFAASRDRRGLVGVACGYCGARLQRVSLATAVAWFGRHRCVGDRPMPAQGAPGAVSRVKVKARCPHSKAVAAEPTGSVLTARPGLGS
jgi:hypothetical protein